MSDFKAENTDYELALPDTPLEGTFHLGKSTLDYLDEDFIRGLSNALRFAEGSKPTIYNAQGRNYYIELPTTVAVYDSIQVAGGGNAEIGVRSNEETPDGLIVLYDSERSKVIDPPSEGSGLFTGFTTYFEDGKFVNRENVNPVGSYTSVSARRKIEATETAGDLFNNSQNRLITPSYIGKFEYDLKDQNGEPQVALLMLVPNCGRRMDSTLTLPYSLALNAQSECRELPDLGLIIPKLYKQVIGPKLNAIGSGLATVHRAGLNHNQPTTGNTDALELVNGDWIPYITDWDTMTTTSPEDAATAHAMDLCTLIGTSATALFGLGEMDAITPELVVELIGVSAFQIIMGYSKKRPEELIKRMTVGKVLHVSDVTNHSTEKIEIVQSWLE